MRVSPPEHGGDTRGPGSTAPMRARRTSALRPSLAERSQGTAQRFLPPPKRNPQRLHMQQVNGGEKKKKGKKKENFLELHQTFFFLIRINFLHKRRFADDWLLQVFFCLRFGVIVKYPKMLSTV